MVIEKRETDEYRKERNVWLLASVIGSVVSIVLMTNAVVYDIRPKYGFYILVLAYIVTFTSFVMYALTQYVSTKEVLSILIRKVCENSS